MSKKHGRKASEKKKKASERKKIASNPNYLYIEMKCMFLAHDVIGRGDKLDGQLTIIDVYC